MVVFETFSESADAIFSMTKRLRRLVNFRESEFFYLALSGGRTALRIFKTWREHFADSIDWYAVKFFWTDERMVESSSSESNFGNALREFFEPMKIPKDRIFEIRTDSGAEACARAYSQKIAREMLSCEFCGEKFFDCCILGVGADGRVGSIFPENFELLNKNEAFLPSVNPRTKKMRVTMTPKTILNSHEILMPIFGGDKRLAAHRIFCEISSGKPALPASFIIKNAAHIVVYSDSI